MGGGGSVCGMVRRGGVLGEEERAVLCIRIRMYSWLHSLYSGY